MARSSADGARILVGVVSDTHGELSSAAAAALAGTDHIIHAGDIVSEEVVPALRRIAPFVTSVRGNMDRAGVAGGLKLTAIAEIGGVSFYVLHDLYRLDLDPLAAGIGVVIHGHTHRADVEWRDGVLYLNPGRAGEPRSSRPASVALIEVAGCRVTPRIIELD